MVGANTPKGHALRTAPCPECGTSGRDNWERADKHPQIGRTYQCQNCEQEATLYDKTQPPARGEDFTIYPVTDWQRIHVYFVDLVGKTPDDATEDLREAGLTRMEAIDYIAVKEEGLSQSEWARRTDRDQSTVSEHIADANRKLSRI